MLFFVGLGISQAQEWTWDRVNHQIDSQYPDTPTIDKETLQQWTQQDTVRIIDVRTPEEFVVGHLRSAHNWTSAKEIQQYTEKEERMVLYCSVGYRSAALVLELKRAGYEQIYNLKGSIFAWANAGLPVYRGEVRASTVHPYNWIWGTLLNKELHAYY